jgi:hypothetical protein
LPLIVLVNTAEERLFDILPLQLELFSPSLSPWLDRPKASACDQLRTYIDGAKGLQKVDVLIACGWPSSIEDRKFRLPVYHGERTSLEWDFEKVAVAKWCRHCGNCGEERSVSRFQILQESKTMGRP